MVTLVTAESQEIRYIGKMKIYPHLAQAIAITLESFRKEKQMNKSVLADFAGVERGYIRDIEKGNRKPTVNTIFCICDALKIEPLDFFQRLAAELEKIQNQKEE